jgi:thiamine kinase-like enzyme
MAPAAFASRLTDWLERWNRATRTIRTIDRGWLEREVLAPAGAVAPRLSGGTGYLERLRSQCAAVEGNAVPLVAAHCDLTTSNIVDVPGGRLGILDWESSQEAGLPLRDLAYGLVDAVWASQRRGSRTQAFADCFEPGGKHRDLARNSETRIRQALGLSDQFAALCFQGCWLQHAADEAAVRTGNEPEPFLGIVARLAGQLDA